MFRFFFFFPFLVLIKSQDVEATMEDLQKPFSEFIKKLEGQFRHNFGAVKVRKKLLIFNDEYSF